MYKRAVAVKVSVKDALNSKVHPSPGGYEPGYAEINGQKVGRVNIIATVIKRGEQIMLDDGTGMILARTFDKEFNAENGDVVRVIGKIRESNGKNYIAIEIMRRLGSPKHLKLRALELKKAMPKPVKENLDIEELEI